jgi:hypothetical protein
MGSKTEYIMIPIDLDLILEFQYQTTTIKHARGEYGLTAHTSKC